MSITRCLVGAFVGLSQVASAEVLEDNAAFWWGSGLEIFPSSGDFYYLGQLGYQWEDWRFFAEIGYVESEAEFFGASFQTEVLPITFNVSYEFEWTERFSGFVSGGIGAAWIGSEVESVFFPVEDDSVVWASQVALGVSFEILENLWIDGTVRYLALGDYEVEGISVEDSGDIAVGIGLRFGF